MIKPHRLRQGALEMFAPWSTPWHPNVKSTQPNTRARELGALDLCPSTGRRLNWGFNVIVSAMLLSIIGAVGGAGAFLIYAVLSLLALGLIAATVPETKGWTLEQIEAALDTTHPSARAHVL